MTPVILWLPADDGDERALTSAELREHDVDDEVTLFVKGELATTFRVAKGIGDALLRECGLERQ